MILNSFFTAILFSIFIDYGVFRYKDSHLSLFEILGVIGGIIGLYKKWQLTVGGIIMKCIYKFKLKNDKLKKIENIKLKENDAEDIKNIEMVIIK